MPQSWFEWLFKFRRLQYAEGEIGLQAHDGLWVLAALVVLAVVAFGVVYAITQRFTSSRDRAVSLGLRIAALLLLCLPLFEPVLITPDVVPDENFVAVLVDDSESMSIPDGTFGPTRADDAYHLLYGGERPLAAALAEPFKVRYYTFSDQVQRVDSLANGRPSGKATNLEAALARVQDDFEGVPLAGVVVMTDGGDNSEAVALNQAEAFRSRDIPLHIVGLGQPAFATEREILDVTVSKGVEATTGAEIDVKARSWREEPSPVTFTLYRDEAPVYTAQQMLKGQGKIDQFTLFYEPEDVGAAEYRLEVAQGGDEVNTANNAINLMIDSRKDTLRVLYLEGHLRREFKFIKRALEDDQVIHFTSVSRTGTGKYYRQGLRAPDELAGGFPNDLQELFGYKAILLGDFEASAFSPSQLQMIEQFVGDRGGGFLMLGGRNTFAEGQYWNTPIADVLPVKLDPARRMVIPEDFTDPEAAPEEQGFRFMPTAAGYEDPAIKLAPDPVANRTRWASLPGLTSINYLGAVKPGALVLAEKGEDQFGAREPLLVVQRYGKGRGAALATASTWRWQMLTDAEDIRHERFWRQLVRWLAASAPRPVDLDLGPKRFVPDEEAQFAVNVYDALYAPLEGADVQGRLVGPDGTERVLTFQADLANPGVYTANLLPPELGVFVLEATATLEGAMLGSHAQSFLVRPSKREFYDATLKEDRLRLLASASRGLYYTAAEAVALPENLRDRRTSTSIYHADYLWDMPLILGLVLLLLCAEWIYRRRRGLP